jgi:hypothetical protein
MTVRFRSNHGEIEQLRCTQSNFLAALCILSRDGMSIGSIALRVVILA